MTAADPDPVPWLDQDERLTWVALVALIALLPASIEAQLGRDANLSLFEYSILAALSERPDGTLQMSQLAVMANGSLSRLSHVARRLEGKNYIRRGPLPQNGRITVAVLLEAGRRAIEEAAPDHVRHARRLVFDPLTGEEQRELGRLALKLVDSLDPAIVATVRGAVDG